MYLTVYPLHARVMIAQWENECISMSILSMAWVMIAQWDSSVCPPCGSGSIPNHGEVFEGIFPWLIMRVASYTVWED